MWNIAMIKCQLNNWPVNYQDGTYDPAKVNFIPAPNDDYMEATKSYAAGQKVTLHLVSNGKLTGKDTSVAPTGVVTWFPGDYEAIKNKGGVCIASTKDFGSQMACAVIVCKKWAVDNKDLLVKYITAMHLGANQVKSHDEALRFGSKVAETVFADNTKTADDWYKAYISYDLADDDGNTTNIGGSRVFNLADAANYVGIIGGQDKYKSVYTTFGNIDLQAYPELIKSIDDYAIVTDWSYLKAAYGANKENAGTVSKQEFTSKNMSSVVGARNYSINFETGSSVIKSSSFAVLNDIYNQLQVADNLLVQVNGYTDNTGNDATNQTLSEGRAQAVVSYLKDKGISSDRLSANGFGSANPVADNSTADGKAKNRRVEIKLGRQ